MTAQARLCLLVRVQTMSHSLSCDRIATAPVVLLHNAEILDETGGEEQKKKGAIERMAIKQRNHLLENRNQRIEEQSKSGQKTGPRLLRDCSKVLSTDFFFIFLFFPSSSSSSSFSFGLGTGRRTRDSRMNILLKLSIYCLYA